MIMDAVKEIFSWFMAFIIAMAICCTFFFVIGFIALLIIK